MDKTYAETQGFAPFDWNKFLDRAEADQISEEEWMNARNLSGEWTTCACGNECAIIPRQSMDNANPGRPVDEYLGYLGMNFHAQIDAKQWDSGREVLSRIEARSSILIAEEIAKLNQRK